MDATIIGKKEIDIKNISLFQFVDVLNSQGILKKYFQSQPDVEIEYFTKEEEKEILATNEYKNLKEAINKEFLYPQGVPSENNNNGNFGEKL